MFNTTIELNNVRKDANYITNSQIKATSPVVEVFSAMVKGEDVGKLGKYADKAVAYIKELGSRAESGDTAAVAELNTIRKYVIETPILQEIKLLGIFGTFEKIGFDESIEREVWGYAGNPSRMQANNGDVPFLARTKEKYPVGTKTISGGYAVDYRRVALGDMTKENEGLEFVKTDIHNKVMQYVLITIYNAIKNATGVKYWYEATTGLTKAGVDGVIADVRRNGKPTVVGDYSILGQFTPWAGYVGTIANNTITGMSQKAMDEIASRGLLATYNGANLVEIENPYNEFELTQDGSNFKTLLPAGLGFVIPSGVKSPIKTWMRGGLTSMTGEDVKSGQYITRFDIEIAADCAKGQEHRIGVIYDQQIGGLE